MMRNFFLIFISLGTFLAYLPSQSESWIGNRFSQNCAGCHAPGRYNLPPAKRRCTLSCQGCHVNPNGGGLRNEYGKWTQQRWLKTFRIKKNRFDKNAPAPDFAQSYMKDSKTLKFGKKKKNKGKVKKKAKRKIPRLATTKALSHKEKYYDQHSNRDWKKDAKSMKQFLSRVPSGDPYRLERSKLLTGGADLRYFYGNFEMENPDAEFDINVLMGTDIGIRIRPTKEHFSLVFENRFSADPRTNSGLVDGGFRRSRVRSAYALADDFFYNTWFMAGLYRPHFGYYTPDHTSLATQLTGMGQDSSYKAIGMGATPFNVPFINIHYITKKGYDGDLSGSQKDFRNESGYNINMGARFVTLGLNGKFSYWSTEGDNPLSPGSKLGRTMYSATGGLRYKRLIANADFLKWSITDPGENAGSIVTFDSKFQVWRENYLVFTSASSNTARNGAPGKASDISFGFKSYLTSGVKLDFMMTQGSSSFDDSNIKTETSLYYLQLHSYF